MEVQDTTQGRQPGPVQIGIILVSACLSVLVTAILGPSLPKMEADFSAVKDIAKLVPISMTVPMLVMSFFCVIAGMLSDKYGRKWLLVWASIAYAAIGTAPLYLESFNAILGSRVLLGFAEAFVVVIGAAYIGDLFEGERRERIFALQALTASTSAFFLNIIGGVLGDIGWRVPYSLYAVGFVLALFVVFFLWEPDRKPKPVASDADQLREPKAKASMVALMCVVVIFGSIAFLTVPVSFAYLFVGIGEESSAKIGGAYGLNSLGIIAGSIAFGWWLNARTNVWGQLTFAFGFLAVGFLLMSVAQAYAVLALAGIIAGLGSGILMPSAIVWCLSLFPAYQRGAAMGYFWSSQFFGSFLAAPVAIVLSQNLGSYAAAMKIVGIAMVVGAVLTLLAALLTRGKATQMVAN